MENKENKIEKPKSKESILEIILLSSKYLLIPYFLVLMCALAIYTYLDVKEFYHLLFSIREMTADDGMMMMLILVDLAMVAFLVKLIVVGSYSSFYKKHEDVTSDPNLNTSSGVLKVKIATALVGVTSISLLQSFIKPEEITMLDLEKKLIIHGTFLVGALVLAIIDILHVKAEAIHHQDCICCKEQGIKH